MAVQVGKSYVLGDFVVELDTLRLTRVGAPVHLTHKPFQVLLYLIENRERLVTRHELLERFWQGHDVYDETLTKCVGAIRKALDDQKEQPRFILTHWAEGYRYVGPVEEHSLGPTTSAFEVERTQGVRVVVEEEDNRAYAEPHQKRIIPVESHPQPLSLRVPKRLSRATLYGSALVIIAFTAGALVVFRQRNRPSSTNQPAAIRSIAVLPLENLSGDPAQEYFADGMTEALINNLAQFSALKVISRTSVMRYKGNRSKSLPEIAHELNVDAVIEGAVQRSGGRVHVTARLIPAAADSPSWSREYDRDESDVMKLQSDVASAVGDEIRIQVTADERTRLAASRPVDPAVNELFLQGLFYLRKQPWLSFWTKSRDYFEQAIARDPSFAPAYAGLASVYTRVALLGPLTRQEAWPKAEGAAQRALELDDNLAEAHMVLGHIRLARDWNWHEAQRQDQRALDLNSNSPDVHSEYAHYLALKGKMEDAVREAKRALELDPLRVDLSDGLGIQLIFARRYDEAIEQLHRSLELDSNSMFAHGFLAEVYALKGMEKEAAEETIKEVTARQDTTLVTGFEKIYKASGYRAAERFLDQRAVNDELKKSHPNSWTLAYTYARLGEKDKAFGWLEKAYRERDVGLLQLWIDPDVYSLRGDPRFADLARRLPLPSSD